MSGKVRITKFSMVEHLGLLPEGWPEGVDLALRTEGEERRVVGVHRDETPDEYLRRIAHTEKRPHRHYLLTPPEEAEALFPVLVESMADTPDLLDLGLEFEMNYDFILSEGLDEAYMRDERSLPPQGADANFIPILSAERLLGIRDANLGFLPDGAAEIAFPNGLGTVEIGAEMVSQSIDGTMTRVDLSGLEDRDMVPSRMRLPAGSLAFSSERNRMASRGKYLFIFLDPLETVTPSRIDPPTDPDHGKLMARMSESPWHIPILMLIGAALALGVGAIGNF